MNRLVLLTFAAAISLLIAEAMKNHPVPGRDKPEARVATYPTIKNHGKVVRLPDAAHQPRSGTKLLVDVTRGGDAETLNPAIEKVAKYVNLYAGGGAEPADVQISVVFHGDATLHVLNSDAYSKHFNATTNPNLDLLHQLHESGVELYVCGQSLLSKGASTEDVAVFVDTAVSALTAIANSQADGYVYLPLLK